jgi:hypothetical protein
LDGSRRHQSSGSLLRLDDAPFNETTTQIFHNNHFQQFRRQNQAGRKALQNETTVVQHQQSQQLNKGMANSGHPQRQEVPLVTPGQDGAQTATYNYDGSNGMRPGTHRQPNSGGSDGLQDYQIQLELLESRNNRRQMAGGPGPNDQRGRQGISPNINHPMTRGTHQLNVSGIPPLHEGSVLPGTMISIPGQMNPQMAPHFYNQMNGMEGNMVGAMPNSMRLPSSANFDGQMNQEMINMAQAQQQQQGSVGVSSWQPRPNSAPTQNLLPQGMGTPQQYPTPSPFAHQHRYMSKENQEVSLDPRMQALEIELQETRKQLAAKKASVESLDKQLNDLHSKRIEKLEVSERRWKELGAERDALNTKADDLQSKLAAEHDKSKELKMHLDEIKNAGEESWKLIENLKMELSKECQNSKKGQELLDETLQQPQNAVRKFNIEQGTWKKQEEKLKEERDTWKNKVEKLKKERKSKVEKLKGDLADVREGLTVKLSEERQKSEAMSETLAWVMKENEALLKMLKEQETEHQYFKEIKETIEKATMKLGNLEKKPAMTGATRTTTIFLGTKEILSVQGYIKERDDRKAINQECRKTL